MIPGHDVAPVLVLGATAQVGHFLVPRLAEAGAPVVAVSRRVPTESRPGVMWMQQDLQHETARVQAGTMISCGPLDLAARQARATPGLRRIVALSSASVHFKRRSGDPVERAVIDELVAAEERLSDLAEQRGIDFTMLRPTLIYGGPGDRNVARVRAWIASRGWAPVCGSGLRQPVHADDLAQLCLRLVPRRGYGLESFDVGGGESLPYPDFLRRIASAEGRDLRLVRMPAGPVMAVLRLARAFGALRGITPEMVRRQRMDLAVDDTPAREILDWNPRPFRPAPG